MHLQGWMHGFHNVIDHNGIIHDIPPEVRPAMGY
jgi:hypothetical protein